MLISFHTYKVTTFIMESGYFHNPSEKRCCFHKNTSWPVHNSYINVGAQRKLRCKL